jgi:hypothetical protein
MITKILPPSPRLPNAPNTIGGVVMWINDFIRSFIEVYRSLADRTEEMIMQGPIASRPAANGKRRFYFDTDNRVMYYDDGTWNAV